MCGYNPALREELAELLVKAFHLGAQGFTVQARRGGLHTLEI